MKKYLLLIAIITFSAGCTNTKKENIKKKISKNTAVERAKKHPGKKIIQQLCIVCHNATASKKNRIAPPLIAIKAHYINENTTKETFIADLKSFLKKPSKNNAKMKGAVRRFGVMPYTPISDKQIEDVANYLYDYKIPEPSWFKAHWKKHQNKPYINKGKETASATTKKTTTEIGLDYALGTKKVLGKNLMSTIQKKGTLEALQFCNHKAYPLTDSMSVKFNAKIKRVSDKPRNPKNTANKKELEIINQYKKLVAKKAEINPITETNNGKTQFYYPIVTNSMCLQCHGKPTQQVKPMTLKKLVALYPLDKATGYTENEVRGIWSITFNN